MSGTPEPYEAILLRKLRTAITEYCVDNVDEDDPSRVNHVIIGKPGRELRNPPVVSISLTHPLGPSKDTDKLVSGTPRGNNDERPYKWPPMTMGGQRVDMLKGTVQVNIRENMSAEEASFVSGAIANRIVKAINEHPELGAFMDDFGFFVTDIESWRRYGYEFGSNRITTGVFWVDFRAFVHSTNVRKEK